MGELAASWTRGFQFGEAPGGVQDPKFLQGVITLKHFDGELQMIDGRRLRGYSQNDLLISLSSLFDNAANSLEDSDGFTRTNFNVNVSNGMLADYYLVPFKHGIRAGARGVM